MQNMEFWAKTYKDQPGISVTHHARHTAAVCRALYPLFFQYQDTSGQDASGQDTEWKDFVAYLAAVHDVGKISPQFQVKCAAWLQRNGLVDEAACNGWRQDGFLHASMSQKALEYYWSIHALHFCNAHTAWAALAGAHHGKIAHVPTDLSHQDVVLPVLSRSPSIDWLAAQHSFLEQQWRECGSPPVPVDLPPSHPRLWLVAGLMTLADWIASDQNFFSADPAHVTPDPATTASQAVAALGFTPLVVRRGLGFSDIFECSPYPMQQSAWEHIRGPGVYVLEAPMGMGKTEAALMAAYACMEAGTARGLYFGLPTQATSNRIFLRVQHFAQKVFVDSMPPQLVHAHAWLRADMASPELAPTADATVADGQDWFASPRRALLAPIGVGTVDQALMAALSVRHFALRRLALAGKVVILDEVHSYDFYTGSLIQKLCELLVRLGSTVIILSATLSAEARNRLLYPEQDSGERGSGEAENAPYPLLSCRKAASHKLVAVASSAPPDRSVAVVFRPEQDALYTALHSAREGAQVLWICNTVAAAQHTFGLLREHCTDTTYTDLAALHLGILHARLPYFMRTEREDFWMQRLGKGGQRDSGSILVATQVVEQSVDLDADVMITELAPTDMLLQRMGRLWRHEQNTRPCSHPRFIILEEQASLEQFRVMSVAQIKKALGSKGHVYAPCILLRTLELWAQLGSVSLPSDIRGLIQATYAEPDELPSAWQALYDARFATDFSYKTLANINADIWRQAMSDVEERAPTRIGETQDVSIVLYKALQNDSRTLLDDTNIKDIGKDFDLATARALHRNAIKIPDYRFSTKMEHAALHKYSLHGFADVQGKKIDLENVKDGYKAQWDKDMGIIWTQ